MIPLRETGRFIINEKKDKQKTESIRIRFFWLPQ